MQSPLDRPRSGTRARRWRCRTCPNKFTKYSEDDSLRDRLLVREPVLAQTGCDVGERGIERHGAAHHDLRASPEVSSSSVGCVLPPEPVGRFMAPLVVGTGRSRDGMESDPPRPRHFGQPPSSFQATAPLQQIGNVVASPDVGVRPGMVQPIWTVGDGDPRRSAMGRKRNSVPSRASCAPPGRASTGGGACSQYHDRGRNRGRAPSRRALPSCCPSST